MDAVTPPSGVWNLELGHPLRCPKEEETEKTKQNKEDLGMQEQKKK